MSAKPHPSFEAVNEGLAADCYPGGCSDLNGSRLRQVAVRVSAVTSLGWRNVLRVIAYRACKRAGLYRHLLPVACSSSLTFPELPPASYAEMPPWADRSVLQEANELLNGHANFFSVHAFKIGNPPDWFLDPFKNQRHIHAGEHWSNIPDFSGDLSDIKVVWEMSRFTWACVFARAFRLSGDARYLSALKTWVGDWWLKNPPNTGPNWMCGQEASIRLINTLVAFDLVRLQPNFSASLADFVDTHCCRINATTSYAIAQDNNHATSEAAALFLGGTWLVANGRRQDKNRGAAWARRGREMLERSVHRLILADGSFAQHSLTYHRLMLDTLSIAEVWRRGLNESPFSTGFYVRAQLATRWLAAMIDPSTGNGPNLGANDGAHAYRLDGSAYRDFRPCLQFASLLFTPGPALGLGAWNEFYHWFGIGSVPTGEGWQSELGSEIFPHGGYVVLRNSGGARVLIRIPTGRFRPAHADAFHVDLWNKGKNIALDGGTYAYANGGRVSDELASVVGHNTIQFDDRDQMPRVSRFLYSNWIRVDGDEEIRKESNQQTWSGRYLDCFGAQHEREVSLKSDELLIIDKLSGFQNKATLRWRLCPGDWAQSETGVSSSVGRVSVQSSVPIQSIRLITGCESRYYRQKSPVPVLNVEVNQSPAVIRTIITLS